MKRHPELVSRHPELVSGSHRVMSEMPKQVRHDSADIGMTVRLSHVILNSFQDLTA